MTLKNSSINYFDSDSESRDESTVINDINDVLNEAFIAAPDESFSYIFDDSSLSIPQLLKLNVEETIVEKVESLKISENDDISKLSRHENNLNIADESLTLSDENSKQCTEMNLRPKSINELNWISSARKHSKPKIDDLYSEIESMHLSENPETADLSKKGDEKPACIFTSTCLDQSVPQFEENDCAKLEHSATAINDESEMFEVGVNPFSRSDYVYHELSAIPEENSICMDESPESFMNSDKYKGFRTENSNIPMLLKANDSVDIFNNLKTLSNYLPCAIQVIQNKQIEKLLKEPGILEESDLTLVMTYFDSASDFCEKSTDQSCCHSNYKIKQFNDEESPSLISFLQHEISCMRSCVE